jgi:very-short-patch-repair endonuclease
VTLAEARKRHAWLVKRARTMRANPTDAERKLWYLLKQRRLMELRWRRQEIIDDRYIVDFICFEHRLFIEADGSQHSDDKADAVRDGYLKEQGFHVLRFWNNDILSNIEGVGETVLGVVKNIAAQTCGAPTPQPLPRRGGGALESELHV